MNFLNNQYIVDNLSRLIVAFAISFVITILLVPLIGRFAQKIGAVDLPARMWKKGERGITTRINENITPKLGGLAIVIAIFITLILTNNLTHINKGIIVGVIIITITGFLDDKFYANSKIQLLGQTFAAFMIILSGITITSINILGFSINFNLLSGFIHIAQYTYHFVFPADIITIVWILGMINVINWVGGVDALNGSVTSIALTTLLLVTLSGEHGPNILLAILILIHLGGVLGVLPFNYNPAKIFYGSIGDFLNGYLLAIFAILGSSKWTATLVILGMPILDGLIVLFMRFKTNPELLKNPLKILSISDTNHLHHRLLAAGYSRKTVVLVEDAIMVFLCSVALYFSNIRRELLGFFLGFAFLFVVFTIIFFLTKKNVKNHQLQKLGHPVDEVELKEPVVNIIIKDNHSSSEDDDKKFVY